jgi:hypothetical protein
MKTVRPSSLKYIEICSDFEQPEQTEVHAVTEAGTRLHYAMETGDLTNIEDDELWMYDRACVARTDLMTDVFGDYEATVYKELSFEVDGRYAGTTDHVAIHANVGLMIDYKFGYNAVDEPGINIQFQDYTVKTFDKFRDLDTLVVAMIAPRRDEVQRHTYKRSDVPELRNRTAMVRARAGTGQRKASNNCQYCSHIGTCEVAYERFAAAKHQEDMLPMLRPNFDMSKPVDLQKALELRPIAKKWLDEWDKAVTEAAKAQLEQGFEIPGFTLKTRQGRPEIVDIDAVKQTAMARGLTEEDWDKCMQVSLTKVENMIKDYAPPRQKTKYAKEFREECGGAIQSGEPIEYIAKQR